MPANINRLAVKASQADLFVDALFRDTAFMGAKEHPVIALPPRPDVLVTFHVPDSDRDLTAIVQLTGTSATDVLTILSLK